MGVPEGGVAAREVFDWIAHVVRRFREVSPRERLLAVEAFGALAIAQYSVQMRLRMSELDGDNQAPDTTTLPRDVQAIGQAVRRVSPHTPWNSRCLAQALAARWMLRRRGVPAQIVVGVRMRDGDLDSHAWLVCGGVPVTGGAEILGQGYRQILPRAQPTASEATASLAR